MKSISISAMPMLRDGGVVWRLEGEDDCGDDIWFDSCLSIFDGLEDEEAEQEVDSDDNTADFEV